MGGPGQITGSPVGHFIGMLNAFLVPLLRRTARQPDRRVGPRRDPAHDARRGPRRLRRRHLLPDEPPRPPRLHRRAPGPDALRRARRLDGPDRRHRARRRSWASRCSAPMAAPSTRRSPAACSTTPRRSGSPPMATRFPASSCALDGRRRDREPGTRLLHRLHRRRPDGGGIRRRGLVPHRRRRRARRRRLPHHHRPRVGHHHPRAARTSAPRRSRSC